MGVVKNKMSKKKNKWYEPYKVVTILDLSETVRRIEGTIVLKFAWSIENYLFYGKKIGNEKYRLYISPREMPPRGNSNPFLPGLILKIITNSEGENIVFFHLKPINFVWMFLLGFLTLALAETNVLVYVGCLCLGAFLLMKYWKFIRKRVGEWLEELLDAKKEPEA